MKVVSIGVSQAKHSLQTNGRKQFPITVSPLSDNKDALLR